MALGLGMLRLSPTAFWTMTPRELRAALSSIIDPGPISRPSREDLARLMEAYPDV
jgi:uncharacterized phage protein (TIGR02216 family)